MLHEINTCIWFEKDAKGAADFYKSVFPDFELISENPLAVNYRIGGRRFMNLNGGPGFPVNPSISFFYTTDSASAIERIWNQLTVGGKILMPLNNYPWNEKYGWCADQFGINWQLMLVKDVASQVVPNMMFVQNNNGKAGEAIEFYTSIFPDSEIQAISRYEKGEPDVEGNIKYSRFNLNALPFSAMESSMQHDFNFNEGVSFILTLDTQDEIDYYWDLFSKEGIPGKCGWIKDKYGVNWQVVPSMLGKLMSDPQTAPKAVYAFLQMSKFIIGDLEKAVQ